VQVDTIKPTLEVPGIKRLNLKHDEVLSSFAVVHPISPTLKVPGTKRLKLKFDKVLSSFAFKFKLRRYTAEEMDRERGFWWSPVGWCRLTLSNPC
jgi:hypothetical protein